VTAIKANYKHRSDKVFDGSKSIIRRRNFHPSFHYNGSRIEEEGIPWTKAKIIDHLAFHLCTVFSEVVDEVTGDMLITHRYYDLLLRKRIPTPIRSEHGVTIDHRGALLSD
jgi:hypothetical protein